MKIIVHEQKSAAESRMQQQRQHLSGSAASAFLHRHYSKFVDGPPKLSGGGGAMKIFLVGDTTRADY